MTSAHDFVIVGGGPAGLSAAIHAARKGFSALLLEAGDQLGPRPRGEGVHWYPLFDELMGKGFLDRICFKTSHGATYHSPGAHKHVSRPSKSPSYFFEWRDLIDRLGEVAASSGVEIKTGARVTGVVEGEKRRCVGVRYDDAGGEQTAEGLTIMGCDGYRSVIGRHYGVDYDELSCRIMKVRIAKANFDPQQVKALQFYFIGNGDLDYAPRFPPAVAYAFPLEDQKMEVGLMLRMAQARTMKTVERPSEETFVEVWSRIKGSYPGFSSLFEGAEIEHEEATDIPNATLVRNNVPATGAVLCGDSVGFIDPFGSSGLYFSMAMAKLWTEAIASSLRAARGDPEKLWTGDNLDAWRQSFYDSKPFRQVRTNHLRVGALEWYVFRHLRTAERINRRWGVISRLLKLA